MKKIIHVIDDLGRGGAETMLVDLLPDLANEYEILLVTLGDKLEFPPEQIQCKRKISLGYKSVKDIPMAALRLRRLINTYRPDLVRSQLFWSTIITRLAVSRSTPFFFSVHATMNEDPIAWHKRKFMLALERVTYRSWHHMIGVTQAVIDSFATVHSTHGETTLLHNFVRDSFFQQSYTASYHKGRTLKLVAVSNIRLIKNISYLVEALALLPRDLVLLDIYGDGPLRCEIEDLIRKQGLYNITLKGKRNDIATLLPQYDVFISPSMVEGFGIAVAEAMSIGLPVIISDIPVYREVGSHCATYIDPKKPVSLQTSIQIILNGQSNLSYISKRNQAYARQMFSKQGYVEKLKQIYHQSGKSK